MAAGPPEIQTLGAVATGQGSFTVLVTGKEILPGAVIAIGGSVFATEHLSTGGLKAVAPLSAAPGRLAAVQVLNPGSTGSDVAVAIVEAANAVVSERAANRFLEQAAWGPSPESVLRVQQIGFEKYIEEQVSAPVSDYPEPPIPDTEQSLTPAQRRFFTNAVHGPDQLRQRVAFALSQIWVASASRLTQTRMMVPYLRLLQANAFSNYRTLMEELTLSPAMGRYLDMVNNAKPPANSRLRANENYAREIMQLFTVGTTKLNQDGSPVLDAQGKPVPTYTQADIEGLARAFTGWTFPVTPGQPPRATNPAYYNGKMVAWDANHDTDAKTLLDGHQLPAGQTAQQDLTASLDYLFNHPNVAPFLATRLIGALVTSNPSPEYVARVAGVFNSDELGRRGELKSVIRAILLDPEARAADSAAHPPKCRPSPRACPVPDQPPARGRRPSGRGKPAAHLQLGHGPECVLSTDGLQLLHAAEPHQRSGREPRGARVRDTHAIERRGAGELRGLGRLPETRSFVDRRPGALGQPGDCSQVVPHRGAQQSAALWPDAGADA